MDIGPVIVYGGSALALSALHSHGFIVWFRQGVRGVVPTLIIAFALGMGLREGCWEHTKSSAYSDFMISVILGLEPKVVFNIPKILHLGLFL